jgi:cation diffusion facilitator CzcD-associated flavoprotein CzcO
VTTPDLEIAIVGAGFGGLAMAIRLVRDDRRSFAVFERAQRIGGVWRDNRYPGCACDIPSPLYSYSFAPNPEWSRMFAPQAEILAYLERCVERYGIAAHLRLGTEIREARFRALADRMREDIDDAGLRDARRDLAPE